jgi:predicted N-acetyltransferase YhbS
VTGIVCHELYGQCRPFMVVEDVIVDRDHRRRGIASDLMRTVERTAIARGCSHIIFVTEARRTDAHRFYQSLGYRADTHKGFKKRLEPPHPGNTGRRLRGCGQTRIRSLARTCAISKGAA